MGIVSSSSFEAFMAILGIFVFLVVVVSFMSEHARERLRSDTALQVGRDRNEAFRDVAAARSLVSMDEQAAVLESAELKLAVGELSERFEKLGKDYFAALAKIEELEKNLASQQVVQAPVVVSEESVPVGTLGDDMIEDLAPEEQAIVFDDIH